MRLSLTILHAWEKAYGNAILGDDITRAEFGEGDDGIS